MFISWHLKNFYEYELGFWEIQSQMYPWISRTLDFWLQFCEKKCFLYMDVYGISFSKCQALGRQPVLFQHDKSHKVPVAKKTELITHYQAVVCHCFKLKGAFLPKPYTCKWKSVASFPFQWFQTKTPNVHLKTAKSRVHQCGSCNTNRWICYKLVTTVQYILQCRLEKGSSEFPWKIPHSVPSDSTGQLQAATDTK